MGAFLMIRPDPAESGPAHVNVVLNWFEEVKRRVPGGEVTGLHCMILSALLLLSRWRAALS